MLCYSIYSLSWIKEVWSKHIYPQWSSRERSRIGHLILPCWIEFYVSIFIDENQQSIIDQLNTNSSTAFSTMLLTIDLNITAERCTLKWIYHLDKKYAFLEMKEEYVFMI